MTSGDGILALLFFLIAALYAAVGQGGGSGYLAAMSLVGVAPAVMKPTALALNVLVAGIGAWKFVRAGHFSRRLFWPIALISMPFAFLGGRVSLPGVYYRPLVAVVLLYAAWRLWRGGKPRPTPVTLPLWAVLLLGAAIGFLSGLSGIGGGIFLAPVLLLLGHSELRTTLGVTAAFVLVNSIAGLAGYVSGAPALPRALPLWLLVAAAGGWLGAEFGSRRLDPLLLRRLLALILVVGGLRLLLA